jgi:hypothetical protein
MADIAPELQRLIQEQRDSLLEEKGKILDDFDPAEKFGGLTGEAIDRIEAINDALDVLERVEEELQDDSNRTLVDSGDGDGETTVASSGSGSGGSDPDDPSGSQGQGGGDTPDAPDGPAGGDARADFDGDMVTGSRRLPGPAKAGGRVDLHTAVMTRLGRVIDDADTLALFSGALRAGLAAPVADDIVGGRQPNVPHRPGGLPAGPLGDPRTGGAVDPADDDDPRHHHP